MVEKNLIDRVYKEINGKFGEGILQSGKDYIEEPRHIIPWSPNLDVILGGGIVGGSRVSVAGPEKSGKTVSCLSFAANAQKPEHGSRPIFYDRVEERLAPEHLDAIEGLDTREPYFNIIRSRRGKILTAQERLDIALTTLRTVPGCVYILDSISTLCEEKEMTEGIGTETRGGGAKLFSQFCRLACGAISVNDCIFIGIAHLIANTSGRGPSRYERTGWTWGYHKDYWLWTWRAEPWEDKGKVVGIKVPWECKSSPLGAPPGMSTEGRIRFGIGIDRVYEMVNTATDASLVRKSGSWFYMDFVKDALPAGEDVPKFHGTDAVYACLRERPEWAALLEKKLKALSGTVNHSV
jgi:recombination protein RecA